MPGACASVTVTLKLQLLLLLAASWLLHTTVVVPLEKVEPLAGVQLTLTLPSQRSVAVGAV